MSPLKYLQKNASVEEHIEALKNGAKVTVEFDLAQISVINYRAGEKTLYSVVALVAVVAISIVLGIAIHPFAYLSLVVAVVPVVALISIRSQGAIFENKLREEGESLKGILETVKYYYIQKKESLLAEANRYVEGYLDKHKRDLSRVHDVERNIFGSDENRPIFRDAKSIAILSESGHPFERLMIQMTAAAGRLVKIHYHMNNDDSYCFVE